MKVVFSNGKLQNKIERAQKNLILVFHKFITKEMTCSCGVQILNKSKHIVLCSNGIYHSTHNAPFLEPHFSVN
jgi:hypothetical protein